MDNTAVIKITYGACMRRLKYQQNVCNSLRVWSPDLSFETLHSRIEELFQIPSTERFSVTYTDIDNDVISISNSDDVQDVVEGPSISSSNNPLRLVVSLMQSESTSVGGEYFSQLTLPGSKHGRVFSPITGLGGRDLREQLRILSFSMLRNRQLNECADPNLESTAKLVKLYETSKWSSSPTEVPVDLIENLLRMVALAVPALVDGLRVYTA